MTSGKPKTSLRNDEKQAQLKDLVEGAVKEVWPSRNVDFIVLAYDPNEGELSFTGKGQAEHFQQALGIALRLLHENAQRSGPQLVTPTAEDIKRLHDQPVH